LKLQDGDLGLRLRSACDEGHKLTISLASVDCVLMSVQAFEIW
jgi:hypothetical protein